MDDPAGKNEMAQNGLHFAELDARTQFQQTAICVIL